MTIYSLYIINKAGGLVYQNDVNPGLSRLSANEYLVMAGTLHGVFAIASKLTPTALKVSTPSLGSSATSSITSASNNSISQLNSNSTILSNYSKGALNPISNSNTSGLRSVDTKFFSIYIFQSITGLKFILITSPNGISGNSGGDLNKNAELAESVLRRIYSIYSDYVMKNPFYSLDMPIRVDLFDQKVTELIKSLS
ncbi:hypothetical protein WICANDRAFT_27018 [Wickerhamomyces anomalus NRRL Y-366-8]|uniref:Trafficking protein particle complex subunit n=1 Tax=Wickerhamomyces anomalus (strain ATCC 58044 / CBS 1984 / NCYC 433 / NRRL Y-366-8) TaxID=683960 RepID=A0A1E3PC20_WICAA|nr:uncharacterized protein WICANDRAFT_27018 [Wickerhamomyces anomalus NRRL Y-366-8]ODQ62850.1 hypothetical protein WICANDRAFT_27018 [Wickerhamomyces anomalus NRRL Y-366-8]